MRTNVVIDDDIIEEAMSLTGITTKKKVIDVALRTLIRLERQRAVLTLEGQVSWEGNLHELREARFVAESGSDYHAGND